MVHRVSFRVASEEALAFWVHRLADEGIDSELDGLRLRFADPEGMGLELASVETPDEPLTANHPEIPEELSLQGFDGVRAYSTEPDASRAFLEEALAFEPTTGSAWEARGEERGSFYAFDEPPAQRGRPGAGTVHHVAWASPMDEHEAWRERVAQAGGRPTPVIDRFYFRRSTSASRAASSSRSPHSGRGSRQTSPSSRSAKHSLPPAYEPLRERLEHVLTPLPDLARHGPPSRSRVGSRGGLARVRSRARVPLGARRRGSPRPGDRARWRGALREVEPSPRGEGAARSAGAARRKHGSAGTGEDGDRRGQACRRPCRIGLSAKPPEPARTRRRARRRRSSSRRCTGRGRCSTPTGARTRQTR